jgi:hypothetical protein
MDEGMLSFKSYLLENPSQKKTETDQFKKLVSQINDAKRGRGYINLHIPGYHAPGEYTKISTIENLPDTNKADFKLVGHDGNESIFIGHKGSRHQQFGGVGNIKDVPFQEKIIDKLDWQTHDVPSHIVVPPEYNHILKKVIWGKNQDKNEPYGEHNIHASYVGDINLIPHGKTDSGENIHILQVDGDTLHNPKHGGQIPTNIVLYKRRGTGKLRDTIIHFRELQQVPATSKEIKQK